MLIRLKDPTHALMPGGEMDIPPNLAFLIGVAPRVFPIVARFATTDGKDWPVAARALVGRLNELAATYKDTLVASEVTVVCDATTSPREVVESGRIGVLIGLRAHGGVESWVNTFILGAACKDGHDILDVEVAVRED